MALTTDPNNPGLGVPGPDGQNKAYLVLSEQERASGFIRPVRRSYKHLPCGTVTSMPMEIAETYARQPDFYNATYCAKCANHLPLLQGETRNFEWVDHKGNPTGEFVGA